MKKKPKRFRKKEDSYGIFFLVFFLSFFAAGFLFFMYSFLTSGAYSDVMLSFFGFAHPTGAFTEASTQVKATISTSSCVCEEGDCGEGCEQVNVNGGTLVGEKLAEIEKGVVAPKDVGVIQDEQRFFFGVVFVLLVLGGWLLYWSLRLRD